MREALGAAVVAASLLVVPASAANVLVLVCKCHSVVVNGEERGCARQSDRVATVDLDNKTLQWSSGAGFEWPAIPAAIASDTINAGVDFRQPRRGPGRLEISSYTISRITGEFTEEGMGHTTDPAYPNIDFVVPAAVTGMCTKVDTPKF